TYWSTAPKVNFLHRLLIYLLLGLFVIGCSRDSLSLQSTREYEDSLTALHGASVSDLVERFITNWGSIEAHRNPEMTEDLVSSKWLEQFADGLDDEPYWVVTESATVQHVRVLEYDPARIKALACLDVVHARYSTDGEFIEVYPATEMCGIFVFALEEGNWKVAAFFNTTVPENVARDWNLAPEWLKIGRASCRERV